MIYLFLAVLFSTLVALILKYSETKKLNRFVVTGANYVVAFSISLLLSMESKLFSIKSESINIADAISEISASLSGEILISSAMGNITWALLSGFAGGIFYFAGFIYIQKCIDENGVSITGAFSKIGILIPMLFALFIWNEIPNLFQSAGIILALFSILAFNISFKDIESLKGFSSTLLLMFFTVGLAEFSNKFFQKYGMINYRSLFLFSVFLTAFFISLFFIIKQQKKVMQKDVLTGFLVGIPNMLTSYFLIHSFKYIKTTIAFPVYSASTVVCIAAGGVVFFGEKPGKKEKIAIVIIIISIGLININP